MGFFVACITLWPGATWVTGSRRNSFGILYYRYCNLVSIIYGIWSFILYIALVNITITIIWHFQLRVLILLFTYFSVKSFLFLFIVVVGLQADGLKKSIFGKPSPYVKLSIMPSRRHLRSWKQHHGQIAKTLFQTNTINPNWTSEVCTKNFV